MLRRQPLTQTIEWTSKTHASIPSLRSTHYKFYRTTNKFTTKLSWSPRLAFFCFWNLTELQGSWMVNRSLIKCTCTAPRVFISPLVSSRQNRQICVVCGSETILDTWIQEMGGGRGQNGGNSLLFSVFGTRTVVFQIAIPRNLLKTSSSSYHISYSVQSISLCKK